QLAGLLDRRLDRIDRHVVHRAIHLVSGRARREPAVDRTNGGWLVVVASVDSLDETVIHSGHRLDVPVEQLCIELRQRVRVLGINFEMRNQILLHTLRAIQTARHVGLRETRGLIRDAPVRARIASAAALANSSKGSSTAFAVWRQGAGQVPTVRARVLTRSITRASSVLRPSASQVPRLPSGPARDPGLGTDPAGWVKTCVSTSTTSGSR